jgi:hypothetical protein
MKERDEPIMDTWLLDASGGRRLPLHRLASGHLVANRRQGHATCRVMVVSMPKAGTYLVARLLDRLGFVDTELHLGETVLTDYRGLPIEEKRGAGFRERVIQLPITMSAGLVTTGQFAVGHLPHTPAVRQALAGFRTIVLVRNPYDAIVSRLRFRVESGREPPETPWVRMAPGPAQALAYLHHVGRDRVVGSIAPLVGWLDEPGVFMASFERLTESRGDELRQRLAALAAFVDADGTDIETLFLNEVLDRPTPTLSSRRTRTRDYLDADVEDLLRSWGFEELARRFGYTPPSA